MPRPESPCVLALAGRRIDPADAATRRFPLPQVPAVRGRLGELLRGERVEMLVSSAACGADLLAQELAAELGLRTRVVLPFSIARFRESSVVDRPGEWGAVFDRAIERARVAGELIVLEEDGEGHDAYTAATHAILREAEAIARDSRLRAVAAVVWEGAPREGTDHTAEFVRSARARGLLVREVSTSE